MKSGKKFFLFMIFILVSIIFAIISSYLGVNLPYVEKIISANLYIASFIYLAIFIVLSTFSFSITAVLSLGALFFSVKEVFIYGMIAIAISSVIHFFIAKKLGREYIRDYLEKKHGKIEQLDEILEHNTFKTILIFSLIYFIPPTIPNLLGGIMKINFKKFFIATFIGNIPNTLLTVFLVNGFFYSNTTEILLSGGGLILVTIIALYFYTGEIKHILRIGFPWAFRKKEKRKK